MVCPFCNAEDTAVVDSRKNVDGDAIRRRRECSACNTRFTTYEKSEIELIVKKRNGNLEEFQYEKLFNGIENAFGGQELSDKKLKNLVDTVFMDLKKHGKKIGRKISRAILVKKAWEKIGRKISRAVLALSLIHI